MRCGIQVGETVYDASAVAQAAGLSLDYQSTDWSKTKQVIANDDRALRLLASGQSRGTIGSRLRPGIRRESDQGGRGNKIGWKMVRFGLSKRSAVAHSVYTKNFRFGESAGTHGQGCFS